MMPPNVEQLWQLQMQAVAEGKVCVVGALIRNTKGHVFVQKRAPTRRLFPSCWDVVGGHVEAGETLFQALAREVTEETGWKLTRLVALLNTFDWTGNRIERREFDFLVEVDGDLTHPVLEKTKVSEHRWLGPNQLEVLKENRLMDDPAIFHLVKRALVFDP